jgi:hypothetical protein
MLSLVHNGAYKEYIKLDKRYGINEERPDSFHEVIRLFIMDSQNNYKQFDTITWRYILVYIDQITAKLDKYTIGNDFNADYPEFIKVLKEIILEVQSEDPKYSILVDRLLKECQSALTSLKDNKVAYANLVDADGITQANFEKYIDLSVLTAMGEAIGIYVYHMTSKIKVLIESDIFGAICDSNITWMLYALLDIIPALDNIKDSKYIKDIHNFTLKLSKNMSDDTFIDLESYEKWYEDEFYGNEEYNPYGEDVYDDWIARHEGFEEAENSDVDISLEELKKSLDDMKADLAELEFDNKIDKLSNKLDGMERKINRILNSDLILPDTGDMTFDFSDIGICDRQIKTARKQLFKSIKDELAGERYKSISEKDRDMIISMYEHVLDGSIFDKHDLDSNILGYVMHIKSIPEIKQLHEEYTISKKIMRRLKREILGV